MATLTNIAKNRYIAGSGGEAFYGFLFFFTRSAAASGPTLTNTSRNSGTLSNIARNVGTLINIAKS